MIAHAAEPCGCRSRVLVTTTRRVSLPPSFRCRLARAQCADLNRLLERKGQDTQVLPRCFARGSTCSVFSPRRTTDVGLFNTGGT